MSASHRRATALLLASWIALAACIHTQPWRPASASGQAVLIQPTEAKTEGGRFYLRVNVQNRGTVPITVQRDAVTMKLADGRSVGAKPGEPWTHAPQVILPGQSHAVFVDFQEQGFVWNDVTSVTVDWSPAITSEGGTRVDVPTMSIQR